MTAKVVVVCNQKGGSGKTTVSMQLAGAFHRRGYRSLVIDADPQNTATRWAASASDEKPFPAPVIGLSAAGGKVHREVAKFIDNYDVILVDCPPAADSLIPQSALLVADLALVPLLPSPLDLWASVGIREVIDQVSNINQSLQSLLVVNQCQPNTKLAKEVVEILSDFGIPLSSVVLRQRTAYRQAAIFGQTVHDLDSAAKPAVAEVEELTDEVCRVLNLPARKIT